MKRLKIAIIGCGRIASKHVEAIYNNRECCELIAVCDVIKERAELKKRNYEEQMQRQGVRVYASYKTMLEECKEIEAITIATESGYHAEIGLYCIAKGKHILIEKPMAMNVEDCQKLIDAAKEHEVCLTVAHQNRFNPVVQKLRYAREHDGFGKLINITARILWNRNDEYYKQAPWRGTWALDGGTLMNQCIHNIDLLRWMADDEIESIYAQCGTFLRPIEAEDFGSIVIRFKKGTIGMVEGSACVYPKNLEETLSVFGQKGTACLGGVAVNQIENWCFEDDNLNQVELIGEEVDSVYGKGHTPLFENFIESINTKKEPYITGEDGRKAVEIVELAYKSSKKNKVMKVGN